MDMGRQHGLECLKRKKGALARARGLYQQLANLDALEQALESAKASKVLVEAMREGTRALKDVNQATPLHEVCACGGGRRVW